MNKTDRKLERKRLWEKYWQLNDKIDKLFSRLLKEHRIKNK